MEKMNTLRELFEKEIILVIFLSILLVLSILFPSNISRYPSMVDWDTIFTLTGLIVITTGVKESGYLDIISRKLLHHIRDERSISLFFVLFSIILSMFLTNDVSLLIVVPLTLTMRRFIRNDISKLIVFEAIAVNVGSTLIPIGNPQNLFLWYQWNISFEDFIIKMLPLFLILTLILIIFTVFVFKKKSITFNNSISQDLDNHKTLFLVSLLLLIIYIIVIKLGYYYWMLPFIFIFYLIFFNRTIIQMDWFLILLFIVIFIDFNIISAIPTISNYLSNIDFSISRNVFLSSIILSQGISNVPATIFISKFSDNWFAIAYGVNIAGNGFIIGSLANLIAMRLSKDRKIWRDFHKYSIPYLIVTGLLAYILWF